MSDHIDVYALVDDVSLLDIAILELSATRARKDQLNQELISSFEEGSFDVDPDFSMSIDRDDESASRFRIRITVTLSAQPGKITVEIGAEYSLESLSTYDIDPDVFLEFANKVATMTLLPYIRQSVADISQRVFTFPLTMPIYKAGQLSFLE